MFGSSILENSPKLIMFSSSILENSPKLIMFSSRIWENSQNVCLSQVLEKILKMYV
jgi:hypothetical protein